ncbi:MAG: penicillin acylase family protein [Burkholderiales bacterium]
MSFQTRDMRMMRWVRWFGVVAAAIAALVLLTILVIVLAMRGSLPQLDGDARVTGLIQPVSVTRDAQGTVSIEATTRDDAIRALGFVHAQERFFEMDLARRAAAGELSALLGKATLKMDEAKRVHRFRSRFAETVLMLRYEDQALLKAYADGVNAGLESLSVKPWQYLALRAEPQPWTPQDTLLVIAEMYSMLQGRTMDTAFSEALLREKLDPALFAWLAPRGGSWDAALDASAFTAAKLPSPALIDTRRGTPPPDDATPPRRGSRSAALDRDPEALVGSNAWAITGQLTPHGGAMLANDMHLGLQVPNIWFRAQLRFTEAGEVRQLVGLTLPGVPALVAGSNGHVAWGFTNAYGLWLDWVPAKGLPVTEANEVIEVKGEDPVTLKVRQTSAGPIIKSHDGRDFALAWSAHRPGAINIRMAAIARAQSVDEALTFAQGAGMPHQNLFIVDKAGNAAWTIAGLMHERNLKQADAGRPRLATLDDVVYSALAPEKYPVVKNPKDGRLWSGNNRKLGGVNGALIGDGGGDLGARGQQIRDRLLEKNRFTEKELIAIQYDNESRFLKRWVSVTRFNAAQSAQPGSAEMLAALQRWNGRADVDQVGHRVVRAFRNRVHDELWKAWVHAAAPSLTKIAIADARLEYPVWQAITEKPMHLLPQPFTSWDDFLSAQAVWVRDELIKAEGSIDKATWGNRNKAAIKHPFTRMAPMLSPYLDMPATPLAGDNHMPAVALSSFGASQHMAVSPGREQDGILTMPGGQSGHPFSPFYGTGHEDWLKQRPAPLLAGEPRYTLTLKRPLNR